MQDCLSVAVNPPLPGVECEVKDEYLGLDGEHCQPSLTSCLVLLGALAGVKALPGHWDGGGLVRTCFGKEGLTCLVQAGNLGVRDTAETV